MQQLRCTCACGMSLCSLPAPCCLPALAGASLRVAGQGAARVLLLKQLGALPQVMKEMVQELWISFQTGQNFEGDMLKLTNYAAALATLLETVRDAADGRWGCAAGWCHRQLPWPLTLLLETPGS